MARITISMRVDNAAFEEGGGSEVARILRELADVYEECGFHVFANLRDINGNPIGSAKLED